MEFAPPLGWIPQVDAAKTGVKNIFSCFYLRLVIKSG